MASTRDGERRPAPRHRRGHRAGHRADRAHFGAEIAGLVAVLTEDLRIGRYPARKAEARARAIRDRRVAAIYAADKLANTRRLLDDGECIDGERLDHYVKTLRLFSEQTPELPFLPELSVALTRLIDRDAGRIGVSIEVVPRTSEHPRP